MTDFSKEARRLLASVLEATAGSPNEASLRHEIEKALEISCNHLSIPWTPFTLDLTLRRAGKAAQFADVAHGAMVIEYEPPRSFSGRAGATLLHAQEQAQNYAVLLKAEEGRALDDYILVAWDGSHISFGRFIGGKAEWETLNSFGSAQAERLLRVLNDDGRPLVHPRLLSALVGPETTLGGSLVPKFFWSLVHATTGNAPTTKTKLLFTEWSRIFGQVVGIQSEQLQQLLMRQGAAHEQNYDEYVPQYLFALNTHIALVAKFVAALSLPNKSQDILDSSIPIKLRLNSLENGTLFLDAGITNMLIGDFFSWYLDDAGWSDFQQDIENLLLRLGNINFDVTQKDPQTTRDLFKGMYESFVPRELRHALGEVYTPDWLAAHALDVLGWEPADQLLDPTCGSGTFLLEAIRRRLTKLSTDGKDITPNGILNGIYGIDLNPLAVLAARASIVVFIAPYLDYDSPIQIPVFLADAINSADITGDVFNHTIQTELGPQTFSIPAKLVQLQQFHQIFGRIRDLINAGVTSKKVVGTISKEFSFPELTKNEQAAFLETTKTLESLHSHGWDGIWCSILADRFAAGAIPKLSHIAGNPPWVKWSHLPPEYANFIKARCLKRGVFSTDRWVGGIESDISTVITFEAIAKWLQKGGKLAFFITGTVFANESSQGFRRLTIEDTGLQASALAVHDFKDIAAFEGVTNHATLLLVEYNGGTQFPIPYIVWRPAIENGVARRTYPDAKTFRETAKRSDLLAAPVPGTDAGPWLKGTQIQHMEWARLFDGSQEANYVARKGITTDRNGIFFVRVRRNVSANLCEIENNPDVARTKGIPKIRANVEKTHIFPLVRGKGVSPFFAKPDQDYCVLVPQRGMHGDPELPISAPRTYSFLSSFKDILEQRSSLRRFQKGQVYWSLWSTGNYTFAPYKVLWKEMSGGKFCAAYTGSSEWPIIGSKIVIPDHKLYFVPLETEQEAAFIVGILNAPHIAEAISAYSSQLSLGVSVVEYLRIPKFDTDNQSHKELSSIAQSITRRGTPPSAEELSKINRLARRLFE